MTETHREFFAYLEALQKAIEADEHDFTCPICGGEAHWERSEYNGHIHSRCEQCKTTLME